MKNVEVTYRNFEYVWAYIYPVPKAVRRVGKGEGVVEKKVIAAMLGYAMARTILFFLKAGKKGFLVLEISAWLHLDPLGSTCNS